MFGLRIIKLSMKSSKLISRIKSTKTKKFISLLHSPSSSSGKSMTWLSPSRHNLLNSRIPSKSKPLLNHLSSSKKALNLPQWRLKTPKQLLKPRVLRSKKLNLLNHRQIGKSSCKALKHLTTQSIKLNKTIQTIPKNLQLPMNPQSSSLWTASSSNATNPRN